MKINLNGLDSLNSARKELLTSEYKEFPHIAYNTLFSHAGQTRVIYDIRKFRIYML